MSSLGDDRGSLGRDAVGALRVTGLESTRRTLARPSWLGTDGSPEGLRTFFEDGVPERFIGRRFRLDDELTIIDTPRGRALRFGTTGLSAPVGVVLDTGRVIEVVEAPQPRELFVNTSLRCFVDTLEAVAGRFPFYDTDAEEDDVESASDDVLQIVRGIDPPAAEPDRYWSTFIDDMRIGDLTTEEVLDEVQQAEWQAMTEAGGP